MRFYGKISQSMTLARPSKLIQSTKSTYGFLPRTKMSEYEQSANRNSHQDSAKCRTCTDFKTWAKQQRNAMNMSTKAPDQHPYSNKDHDNNANDESRRADCPFDKDSLGRATWGLLHTIGVTFPESPTDTDKKHMINFMHSLGHLYPCETCAHDLREILNKDPVDVSSQKNLSQWLCRLHNKVNIKIGKPQFDCSKIYERWRDGWADGSCD